MHQSRSSRGPIGMFLPDKTGQLTSLVNCRKWSGAQKKPMALSQSIPLSQSSMRSPVSYLSISLKNGQKKVSLALLYSIALQHCSIALPYSTALQHCSITLLNNAALQHCSTVLLYSTALQHRSTALLYGTALKALL